MTHPKRNSAARRSDGGVLAVVALVALIIATVWINAAMK